MLSSGFYAAVPTPVSRWSLATLLYETMAGLPPFYDTNVEVRMRALRRVAARESAVGAPYQQQAPNYDDGS